MNNMRPRKPMNRNFQGGQGGGQNRPMQRRGYRPGGQQGGFDKQARMRAQQNREKYLAKARDALASGDRVEAENWFQHAEHYYRVLVSLTPPEQLQPQEHDGQERQDAQGDATMDENAGSPSQDHAPQEPRPQQAPPRQDSPVMEHGGYDRPAFDRPGYQPRQQRRRPMGDQPQGDQPRQPGELRSRQEAAPGFGEKQGLPPFLAEEPVRRERKPAPPREEGVMSERKDEE